MPINQYLCLDDFEVPARRRLPRPIFGYIAGAAETNQSWRSNAESFEQYSFVPRILADVSGRTTKTTLFGHAYDAPFGLAPMGIAALYAYRGDIVLAKAARAANVPAIMSASSLIKFEDVVKDAPSTWFQAYLPGDDAAIVALIERVKKAGFQTLVITVDTPVSANRENNVRTGFSTPLRPSLALAWQGITHPRWLMGTFFKTLLLHGVPHFENNFAHRGAPILSPHVARDFTNRDHLCWDHLALIRRIWPGNLVVKGILHPLDAKRAVDHGANGVILSNHGGRQLDGSVAPLTVLPAVVKACPSIPIMLDGGVRRGSDVLKALALGASFVFVGRPFAYAASVAGEAGVRKAIHILQTEILRNMGLLGVTSFDQLDTDFLSKH